MSAFLSEEDKAKASSWNHSYAAADERAGEDSLGNPAGEERFWRWQQQQQQRQQDKKHLTAVPYKWSYRTVKL